MARYGLLVGTVIALAACTSESPDPAPGDLPTASADTAEGRDPLLWPYPSDSIWNHPLGDDARLVPFSSVVGEKVITAEEDLLIIDPRAEPRDVLATTAGWDPTQTRCGSGTEDVLIDGVPIPAGWSTDPGYTGVTPNHSAAVVMPDLTLLETQPLHVCEDGRVVSQYASELWRGSSIVSGGLADDIGGGSHGGSGLTAFGGTIRLGEWVEGGRIPHALKITVDGTTLSADEGGFRWPASRADATYATDYRGDNPVARMGALVTVDPAFDVDRLRTEPARILATALREYGAYVVDNADLSTVGFAMEWGPQGRVRDEFTGEWGFDLDRPPLETDTEHADFLDDLRTVYAAFVIVDDNSADSIGGAGDRLAPWAPPLADTEGQ